MIPRSRPLTLFSGGPELLELLKADSSLLANASAKLGLNEMEILFKYLDAYGVIGKVSIIRVFVLPVLL